ncbi:uncharacterized protein LOC115631657 [Scaptodrosophila lebanonensis]|uniref:Uncharacterized protein LOC115631657 n=1 Tax=Drosophila lebanonensis TaxID=7225 RepID=A0A6J2U7N8_DROLE|nr:uncharacterized protein LOC115631657 [Scaptodrosophila lebanonensis]
MPAHCAVANCSDKYVHGGSISFHRFPFKRKNLLQKWQQFTMRSAQWMPSKWSAVCSRHFLETDFNCTNNRKTLKKNAVPTVRVEPDSPASEAGKQTLSSTAEGIASTNGTKTTCRFCGLSAPYCVSFDNSFELFGMVQKCFPTLQILQDDTLPKDICGECHKQLQRFSQFIDVVMQAQSDLQRKYRRQPKIKQEPAVRVKQEACESLDNLFPDELDMGMDEGCCEHEQVTSDEATEQKLQFCDFPMLNAQDIINNCDIMEIINLDDPFINIPDDSDVVQQSQTQAAHPGAVNATNLQSATEMLQAEMLTEEHNYAKEDWQLPPHQYKTEKLECSEQAEQQTAASAAATVKPPPEPRSSRPIVTNVSEIPNPLLCELLPPPTATSTSLAANTTPTSKPNIVVLNDSVVPFSADFRFHNCTLCTAKFFTADSLNQHYAHTHVANSQPPPMVSVPLLNVSTTKAMPLKLETTSSTQSLPSVPLLSAHNDYWQASDAWRPNAMFQPGTGLQAPKKKIDILDMQRSFLHHDDLMPKLATHLPPQPPPDTSHSIISTVDPSLNDVSANYAKLSARFRRLQRQCRKLKDVSKARAARRSCRQCSKRFTSIRTLLRHRRLKRHFVAKPQHFAAKCCGCFRLFYSRLGLRQHMRYICQSLPLRSTRLNSFKCRHCHAITFTHWRIYRRHELKCRTRQLNLGSQIMSKHLPKRSRRNLPVRTVGGSNKNSCHVCQKTFSSVTGLKQHLVTHTTERRYKCGICAKVFKRRNGLSQHIKGFHLQLKPHECPVCKHRYALKCDMLRCRHSQRRGGGAPGTATFSAIEE